MSAPSIPQRPARSPNRPVAPQASADAPTVPPRPQRISAPSHSQERAASARSPLNDTGFSVNGTARNKPANNITEEELRRPPSVPSLPLIGQEGMEYASLSNPQIAAIQKATGATHPKAPEETRNVASDLPLHAPTASASPMTQRSRVATVTRTDTEKAAVAGVGRPTTDYVEPDRSSPIARFRPASAASTERPSSSQAQSMLEVEEHGIPSFGSTIPLYPNAGDVQAPTPAPLSAGLTPDNLSRPGTTEGRRRSAMGFHGPPGSYGLHGHGHMPQHKFEKAWYERHPEELAKEEEHIHHPASHDERPSWAMSSDELNKLVQDTGRSASGFGTNPDMIGTPTEAIGYSASYEYASTPQTPHFAHHHPGRRGSRPSSSSYAESPLKQTISAQQLSRDSETVEKESDDDKVHVVPPTGPRGKYSGAGYDPPTENLGPTGGNTEERGGWIDERGEGVPILASDEIAKYPSTEWMQPAISPAQQMTEDEYFSAADNDAQPSYQTHTRSRSKGHSRPSSMHSSSGLSRFNTHEDGTGTPLEEIEEYEPLFKEDEKDDQITKGVPKRPTDRLKQQHFPSQDIWEDTPDSLRLVTTVDTPEPTAPASTTEKKPSAVFESAETEQLRKGEFTESEREDVLHDPHKSQVKPKFKAGVKEDMYRPSLRQRFPSRDIWEDTPDSLRLETTIGGNEAANVHAKSPESTQKPTIPTRPIRARGEEKADAPSVPARPQARDIPSIPDRPKPSVPQRPARALNKDSADVSPLAKTNSAESATSPEGPSASGTKPKPAVPARPAGSSKFAAIKGGFLNDLNSRLSKGPAPPPKPQQDEAAKAEEDKALLGDARKGRARGPARRKPAVSPQPSADGPASLGGFTIAAPWTVWSIDGTRGGDLKVNAGITSEAPEPVSQKTAPQLKELPTSSPLPTNTAGESLQRKADTPGISAGQLAHAPSPSMDERAHRESEAAKERLRQLDRERIGFEGDMPDPIVDQPTAIPSLPQEAEGTGAALTRQQSDEKDNPMSIANIKEEAASDKVAPTETTITDAKSGLDPDDVEPQVTSSKATAAEA